MKDVVIKGKNGFLLHFDQCFDLRLMRAQHKSSKKFLCKCPRFLNSFREPDQLCNIAGYNHTNG